MIINTFPFMLAISLGVPLMAAPPFITATVKHVAPEQATIKIPLDAGEMAEQMRLQGGPGSKTPEQINYKEASLRMLLRRAYKLKPYQISGPSWIDTERYDVVAQMSPGTTWDQMLDMLQALLIERFQLQLHSSKKTLMVYHLTIAKGGAKLLPPVQPPFKTDAKQMVAEMRRKMEANKEAMQREPGRQSTSRSFGIPSGTTEKLAQTLSSYLFAPVRDDTKIEGLYAFRVEWVPENRNALPGPNLFMAVEEQLGLKLHSEDEADEALVIDRAEMEPVGK